MRNITDALLTKTTALPAAAATANGESIDLGQAGDASIESIEVQVAIPALANLADTKSATLTIQDSADDSTFAAVTGLSTLAVTGAGGAGAAASSRKVKLPSTVRRYIRASVAVDASGGDNTGDSFTLEVLT